MGFSIFGGFPIKTVSYFIDGFNVYHALENNPSFHKYKWLNYDKLTKCFLPPKTNKTQIIFSDIYYFSALTYWNVDKMLRHKNYIKALENVGVEFIRGNFREVDKLCLKCNKYYKTHEEKQTDVNIAIYLFELAYVDVSDIKCMHLYEKLINRSRQQQKAIRFPFRCDAPDRRRFMEMEIYPLDKNATGFKSCIVREEMREPVLLLDIESDKSDEILVICSWCKKVKIDESNWAEAERAIEALELFNVPLLPQLSHGMCSSCYENMQSEFIDE